MRETDRQTDRQKRDRQTERERESSSKLTSQSTVVGVLQVDAVLLVTLGQPLLALVD